MSTELEALLRHRMEHATAEIQVPRSLARRAARHRRRRIITQASAAAAVTIAALTAAVVVAGTTGASGDAGTAVTARLASKIESAVAAAAGSDIVYLQNTNGWEDDWYYRDPRRELTRTKDISPSGQPRGDFASIETPAIRTETSVNYDSKTWWALTWKWQGMDSGPSRQTSCSTPMSVNPHQDPATLAANIREAFACGQLTTKGTENVNGLNAIKLVSVRTSDRPAPAVYTMTLWVDPATDLPIRWQSIITVEGHTRSLDQNITWLSPTSANLAQFKVQIPAGFTQIQSLLPLRDAQGRARVSQALAPPAVYASALASSPPHS
jgi:hypothetical protein